MLLSYLKIAIRNLVRYKSFSFINIAGLAIGISCTLFISFWVQDELSYDSFHADADRMYRVNSHLSESDIKAAVTCPPLAEAVKREMPGVEDAIRISMPYKALIQAGDRKFEESRIYYADANFFHFFSFELLKGDPHLALAIPENIVLSEAMAMKYFGTIDVLGRTIRKVEENKEFTISGVMRSSPHSSHLQFDFIEPLSFLARTNDEIRDNVWDSFVLYTYVKLDHEASASELTTVDNHIGQLFHKHEKQFKGDFFLLPMRAIHFTPGLLADVPGISDIQYVYIFSVVGIFMLLVACINFTSLATARSARRAKEVGLRKVTGAYRSQIISQFLVESILITLVAMVIALTMTSAGLPYFNAFAGKSIVFNLTDPSLVIKLVAITLVTGILAGSYPALFLSGFIPAKVLKGELRSGASGTLFRNIMVAAQFCVSIMLLVGTVVVFQQMQFISNRNNGYDKENLLYIPLNGTLGRDAERLRSMLNSHPQISAYTFVSELPTNVVNAVASVKWEGKNPENSPLFTILEVDENFINIFKTNLLTGRSFSSNVKSDTSNFIVNQRALDVMGMTKDNAVGQKMSLYGREGTIVGVLEDFNFRPVHSSIEPMIMLMNSGYGTLVVRIEPHALKTSLGYLDDICRTLNSEYPFTYAFVDQDLDNMYRSEQKLGNLFSLFAGLGLFISCLGLYGLSAFLAERRTKEIGVRKVLGANVAGIAWMMSANFTRPIVAAGIIAIPLSWYVMNQWLGTFVYRIDLSWSVFTLAFGVSLLVAWLTVSYETLKAASANPVRSLKNE
ncbi:MAG: ABC transporter permease [Chryseolinea sp.]